MLNKDDYFKFANKIYALLQIPYKFLGQFDLFLPQFERMIRRDARRYKYMMINDSANVIMSASINNTDVLKCMPYLLRR